MTDAVVKKLTDEVKAVINGSLDDIRSQMTEIENKSSSRYDELKQQHDSAIADALKLKDEIKRLEAAASRSNVGSGSVVEPSNVEHKTAFSKYLRTASAADLRSLEKKALSIGTDTEGGYFAPTELYNRIIETLFETNDFRNPTYGANVIQTSYKEVELYTDLDEYGSGWEAESQTQAETDTGEAGKIRIPVFKLTAEPRASEEMLMDGSFDVEAWIATKISSKFDRDEKEAFLEGNGVSRPMGILTYTSGTDHTAQEIEHVLSGTADTFDHVDLIRLRSSLKSGYGGNAVWFGSRETYGFIARILDDEDRFIFSPQDLLNDTLLGRPFLRFDDMANPGAADVWTTGNVAVGFGNLKEGYTIVDRVGLSILRDPYTTKGRVKFYCVKRTGGAVVNFEAIKLLEIS